MRKLSRIQVAIAIFLLFALTGAAAQDKDAAGAPAIPFPTRLRAAMRNGRVELSWQDAAEAPGGVQIYRHVMQITAETFSAASPIGSVGKGVQSYVDTPPDESLYYYAALSLASDGSAYPAFIAASNTTAAPISLKPASAEPLLIVSGKTAQSPAASAAPPAAAPAPIAAALAPATSPIAAAPTAAPAAAAPVAVSAQPAPATVKPATPSAKAQAAPAAPVESSKPAPLASEAKIPAAAPIAEATPRSSGPIESLSAQARDDSIVITYAGGAGKRLILYRGLGPIERSSDLLDASLVATFSDKDGKFIDYPVPGIDYWYAILTENDLKAGKIELVKGKNSSIAAVGVALTRRNAAVAEISPTSRSQPLPAFLLDAATGFAVPASAGSPATPAVLAPDSEKAVAAILAKAPPIKSPLPSLTILPEERGSPSGGEDYALSLIVSQKLARGDWAASTDQLRKYLSLNRSEKAAARAHFYLGEALAFAGAYRDGFFEFLSARAYYPIECAPWIAYVLAALR